MNYKESFIEFMVQSGVLTFGDFTTKSGRKTPYFINTGNYKTGAQISRLGEYYAAFMNENFTELEGAFLYGPAYKGIVLASAAAAALYRQYQTDLPVTYNRKEAKDHGEGGSLIGYLPQKGDSAYIIEDVITAGTSVRESMSILNHYEVGCKGLLISVDRCELGQNGITAKEEILQEFGIKTYAIVTIRDICAYLYNRPICLTKDAEPVVLIDDTMKERIEIYLKQYGEPVGER